MSTQIPFTPVTPESLARLTPAEQQAFTMACEWLAGDLKPPADVIVTLVQAVQRLITDHGGPPRADAEAKLAEIHASVIDGFLGTYGHSTLASFKVAVDLANSVRKILDGSGVASRERVLAEAVAAERERIRRMAVRNNAVCTGDEGTSCYFADLLAEGPQS
jgi:hypothetical protein